MASTYSDLKIELMSVGEVGTAGNWGDTTNINFSVALQEAIAGYAEASIPGDGNYTLAWNDTNNAQVARNYMLIVTSAVSLSATRELVVPSMEKSYVVINSTTGGQSITVKNSTGSGVTIPNGSRTIVINDSSNVSAAINYLPSLSLGSAMGIASGGTGAATQQGAINAIAGATTNKYYLRGNGTNVVMAALDAGDLVNTVLAANGGTNQDSSAWTGVAYVSAGTWSAQGTSGTGNFVRATNATITTPTVVQPGLQAPSFSDYYTELYTANNANSYSTVTLSNGTIQRITLNQAATTLTFPAASAGKSFTLFITQDGTGGRTLTWPNSTVLKWAGGTGPTVTSTASATDIYSFVSDGTYWYGLMSGKAFS